MGTMIHKAEKYKIFYSWVHFILYLHVLGNISKLMMQWKMSHSKHDSDFFQLEQIEDDESRILNTDSGSKFLSIQSDGAFCLERAPFSCVFSNKRMLSNWVSLQNSKL